MKVMKVLDKEKYEELKKELQYVSRNEQDDYIRNVKMKEIIEKMKQYVSFENNVIDEVEETIVEINQKYSKYSTSIESDFLEKGCYYFAYMLKKIYKEDAQIYTDISDNIHAITKINGNFYDVRGKINIDKDNSYYPASELDYEYFRDLCWIGRSKENMKQFESNCDEVLEEILQEREENKKKK